MKTFKTLYLILALAAGQVLTSCLGSDSKGYTVTTNFADMFNAVISVNDGEITLYPKQSVKVDWMYNDENTADVQIIGLQLPDVGAFPLLQFSKLPWTINNKGWMDISFSGLKPDSGSGYAGNLEFSRFNLQTINRSYNNYNFPPCINISYTINDEFRIYTLPCEIIEVGETNVTNLATGETFRQDDSTRSVYYIELDPVTHKGYLVIQGAQFAQNMPGLNMKFAGIPFEVSPNGAISMNCEELIPSLMSSQGDITQAGTPAPNYPISKVRVSYIADYGVNISFNCTPHTKDGKPMGEYAVVFTSKYPTSANSGN